MHFVLLLPAPVAQLERAADFKKEPLQRNRNLQSGRCCIGETSANLTVAIPRKPSRGSVEAIRAAPETVKRWSRPQSRASGGDESRSGTLIRRLQVRVLPGVQKPRHGKMDMAPRKGDVAEWLGKGLQNPVRRFESVRHLNSFHSVQMYRVEGVVMHGVG